jgi:hypothetical protein
LPFSLTSCYQYFRTAPERSEPHAGSASAESPTVRRAAAAAENPAARDQRRHAQHCHRQPETTPVARCFHSTFYSFPHHQTHLKTFASIRHLTFVHKSPKSFIEITHIDR